MPPQNATFHFDGGLTNQGLFGCSFGNSTVVGQIANSGGTISVNGGAEVTFVGNIAQNGALLVNQRREHAEQRRLSGNI